MGDFGYLSDTDDSAVEELVSQAKELSALEQIAAINCSSFTDSTLPDDLEARFRRLKTLPSSKPHPVSSSSSSSMKNKKKHLAHSKSVANSSGNRRNPGIKIGSVSLSDEESGKNEKYGSGDFSDSGVLSPIKRRVESSSSSEQDTEERLTPESKSKPKGSSSWLDKLSPSKIIGSIWRSSKKTSTKDNNKKKSIKSFKISGRERDIDDFDEFLSDLNAFSVEDQRKMLKKALKEQQKMRKEAAEIIKMAKQASARFDFDD